MKISKSIIIVVLLSGYVSLHGWNWPFSAKEKNTVYESGIVVTKKHTIHDIKTIEASGNFYLKVRQADTESLVIEADKNIMPFVQVDVVDHVLKINIKDDVRLELNNSITCYINVKNVQTIKQAGAITLDIEVDNEELSLESSGSSTTFGSITTKKLSITARGYAKIDLGGKTSSQNLVISGSVTYDGTDLESEICKLKVSGNADVTVKASKEITGSVSGSSVLYYIGKPKINVSTSGFSSIKKAS